MELFKGVDKEKSGWSLKGRNVVFALAKKEADREDYWPRLTKDAAKNSKIAIDWSRWVDEDEVHEAPAHDDGDLQGFGDMSGASGMDDLNMGGIMGGPDSDDEDEEEAEGEPHKGFLDDLAGEVEKPI